MSSFRFNFDVACSMNFMQFPVDEQGCSIKFESFGHTVEEVIISPVSYTHLTLPTILLV